MPAIKPELVDAKTQFRDLLIDSAESSFEAVLGVKGRIVLSFHIPSDLIGDDVERFHERLNAVVKAPARTFEYLIAKKVYERLGVGYVFEEPFDFLQSIQEARKIAMRMFAEKGDKA